MVDCPGSREALRLQGLGRPRSKNAAALCVAWGANHDWGKVQRRRVDREGERPVPHYWEHVMWVWGHDDLDEFLDFADGVNLDGVVENITVPFLIAHGENDRQIPVEYAHRSYEQATASPKQQLRIFTAEEGGAEHVGLDHLPHVSDFVAELELPHQEARSARAFSSPAVRISSTACSPVIARASCMLEMRTVISPTARVLARVGSRDQSLASRCATSSTIAATPR
ncbi:alpha/beta hydrolase [Rhodococcus oxybenzonivorans]|uniref:alpha/beta hydrolase family protein n=1 Tax=Rhodococcus oxybenzonivorans TaxID=1990687 RepID=UPI0030019BCD